MIEKIDQAQIYAQCLKQRYPDLPIENISLNQEGQYNDVIVVNDALIFRFARYPVAIETLQRETVLLANIQNYLSLAIPQPIYQNLATQTVGEAFIGYPLIPGRTLQYEDFQAIDRPATVDRLAVQLATFLRELHAIPLGVIPLELPLADTHQESAELYGRIRAKLFAYMRPEARRQVSRQFETFLDHPAIGAFRPVLRHGDFGFGNLIFEPDSFDLTGVIDFGFAGLGDAAIDFAGVLASFGEAFLQKCARVYPEIEDMWERVRFYQSTFALQEALFGIENGDAEAFASGMAGYLFF